jgi:NAD(P)-dependent dehydrogenase (short-subunit alcohol dehydrogenase family)
MPSSSIAGKNVVIIGGTAGIGLAAAQAAAAAGARVWVAGRSEKHIENAKQVAQGAFEVRQADTHDAAALTALFEEVGTIDHLVSAAVGGERTLKPFLEQTEEQFKAAYDKLWGYAKVVRTGAPYLAADGAVTLVSGSPARKIRPAQSPLSCVVSPGTVDTAMFDAMGEAKEANLAAVTASHLIPRAGTSEEVADGILFVMQNRFVTGTTVDVDGGRILS